MELSWKEVFNTNHKIHGFIDVAFEMAKNSGYPYMIWNDRVYEVKTRLELLGVVVK